VLQLVKEKGEEKKRKEDEERIGSKRF